MKIFSNLILAPGMFICLSTFAFADDFELISRGLSPENGADYLHDIVLFNPLPPDPIACPEGGNAFIE